MTIRCKRCSRPLKNPESIVIGFGKTCAKKEGIIMTTGKRGRKKSNPKKDENMFIYDFDEVDENEK